MTNSFNSNFKGMRRLRYSPIKLQEEISFKTVVRSMKYSIAVWSTGFNVLIDAIDTLHCKAAKLKPKISDRNLTDKEISSKVNWQQLTYICKKRLKYMRSIYYGTYPYLISTPFEKREGRIRHKVQLDIKHFRKDISRNSLRYRGPLLLWNAIGNSLTHRVSRATSNYILIL